jgi:hypothetical protein
MGVNVDDAHALASDGNLTPLGLHRSTTPERVRTGSGACNGLEEMSAVGHMRTFLSDP